MTSEPTALHGLYVEGVNVSGMPVKCSGCGGKFHQLTDRFRNEPPMRGSFLKMIAKYRGWGWYAFPENDWVVGDNVQCPQCGTPYSTTSIMRQVMALVNQGRGIMSEPVLLESLPVDPPAEAVVLSLEEPVFEPEVFAPQDTIYTVDSESAENIKMTVMRMTSEGCTQASIAQTCNLSVYMVRQIQNGRKV